MRGLRSPHAWGTVELSLAARAAARPSVPGWGTLPEAKAERELRGRASPSRPIPVCEEKGKKQVLKDPEVAVWL